MLIVGLPFITKVELSLSSETSVRYLTVVNGTVTDFN